MPRAERALLGALLLGGMSCPGRAAPALRLALPSGNLGEALAALGAATGVSIGVTDPRLAARRVAALDGRMTVDAAIRRLTRGFNACPVRIDAQSYRIDPCPIAPRPKPAPPSPIGTASPEAATIIVTASKRNVTAADYAGTAIIVPGDALGPAAGPAGTAAIVARLPTLASTNLGSGRNKLFIRGVADSSFNGPTQATVGQYLGDVRLNYNAPDPDLRLYDIARVEVLEGPQGTLYGAGALGGIFRIVPEPVDLDRPHASLAAGLSDTSHGAPGSDVAAMLNLPVVAGRVGLRGVAYRSIDGGYIDDVARGVSDINRTRTIGGRLALTGDLGDDWAITLSATLQNIDSADGQYAERDLPALERRSAVAQPFDNDYALGSVTLSKQWDETRLISATSMIRHHVDASYDFTPVGGAPTLFVQRNAIALYANETRLSHEGPDGSGWLVGSSLVLDEERLTRTLGLVAAPVRIAGVRNTIADGALFGEITQELARHLLLTAGARVSITRLGGEGLDQGESAGEPSRRQARLLPSVALSWRLGWHDATLFTRVEQGFRPGGLEVNGEADSQTVQRFRGDVITTWELGLRAGQDRPGHLDVAASLFYNSWNDIQADLVGSTGQPYSVNIGRGRIVGAEASLGWRPTAGLSLQASAFLNDSQLTDPATGFSGSDATLLPNIPVVGGRVGLIYSHRLSDRWSVSAATSLRYVGRSRLGVGPLLNIPQGNYLDGSADVRLGDDHIGIDLSVANLTDTTANTFSLGDPFRVAQRQQTTPVRPRTVRLGFDLRF